MRRHCPAGAGSYPAVLLLCLTVIGLATAVVAMSRSTQQSVEDLFQVLDITVRCQMLKDVNEYRSPGDDLAGVAVAAERALRLAAYRSRR